MPDDITVIRTFSNEMDAEMARQMLRNAGIEAFVFKDDAGGMEPYLQLTNSVRLVVSKENANRAYEVIQTFDGLL